MFIFQHLKFPTPTLSAQSPQHNQPKNEKADIGPTSVLRLNGHRSGAFELIEPNQPLASQPAKFGERWVHYISRGSSGRGGSSSWIEQAEEG